MQKIEPSLADSRGMFIVVQSGTRRMMRFGSSYSASDPESSALSPYSIKVNGG